MIPVPVMLVRYIVYESVISVIIVWFDSTADNISYDAFKHQLYYNTSFSLQSLGLYVPYHTSVLL